MAEKIGQPLDLGFFLVADRDALVTAAPELLFPVPAGRTSAWRGSSEASEPRSFAAAGSRLAASPTLSCQPDPVWPRRQDFRVSRILFGRVGKTFASAGSRLTASAGLLYQPDPVWPCRQDFRGDRIAFGRVGGTFVTAGFCLAASARLLRIRFGFKSGSSHLGRTSAAEAAVQAFGLPDLIRRAVLKPNSEPTGADRIAFKSGSSHLGRTSAAEASRGRGSGLWLPRFDPAGGAET